MHCVLIACTVLTQEVVTMITATLHEDRIMADLKPMPEVKPLEEYTAIVLFAPLYVLHWHREELAFRSQHRKFEMHAGSKKV